jgi:hypothetical protein
MSPSVVTRNVSGEISTSKKPTPCRFFEDGQADAVHGNAVAGAKVGAEG